MLHLTPEPRTLHFKRPAATSRGLLYTREIVLLRAERDGVVGWGECGAAPGLSLDDTNDYVEQVARLCAEVNAGARPDELDLARWPSVAFGLETALLDLARGGHGLLFDTPFARGEAGLPTHGLIWMDTPAGLLRQIESKLAAGHRVLKLKVAARALADELAVLAHVRERWPADVVELRLDANGGWRVDEAWAALEALAAYDIAWLEQPIAAGQPDALAELCAASPIPLALDEELIGADDPAALLRYIQPQHVVLKPSLLGGLAACQRWIDAASALGIGWWINSLLESNVGLNAIAQWTSSLPGARIHGIGTGQLFDANLPPPLGMRGAMLWRVK